MHRGLAERAIPDLRLDQLVLIEEEEGGLAGGLRANERQKRLHEQLDAGALVPRSLRNLFDPETLEGDVSVAEDRAEELLVSLRAGEHLHVDQDGKEAAAEPSAHDLEQDGGLARAPLTAEHDDPVRFPFPDLAGHELKIVFAAEEHLAGLDGVADDVGIRDQRGHRWSPLQESVAVWARSASFRHILSISDFRCVWSVSVPYAPSKAQR